MGTSLAEVGDRSTITTVLVRANATHGYPRSNDDKRQAVMTLLRDPEWSQWSNYEIADRCHVSESMVRQHRASLRTERSEPPAGRRYTTKHGTVTTMKTEAIGRRAVSCRCGSSIGGPVLFSAPSDASRSREADGSAPQDRRRERRILGRLSGLGGECNRGCGFRALAAHIFAS
jgi:hypothetical protein